MSTRTHELFLGLLVTGLAGLLLAIAIPYGIVSPKSARSLFLAPTFWPTILGWLLALSGAVMVCRAWMLPDGEEAAAPETGPGDGPDTDSTGHVAAFALLLVVYFLAIPLLGMVWTSALAFAALIAITRSPHPVLGLVCAFVLPLVLYGFFNHVAGVAIPQGQIVRLP